MKPTRCTGAQIVRILLQTAKGEMTTVEVRRINGDGLVPDQRRRRADRLCLLVDGDAPGRS